MIKYFNADSIRNRMDLRTAPSGFKYGFIQDIFREDVYTELVKTFPDMSTFKFVDKMSGGGRKRFYVGPTYDANLHAGCACHLSGLPPIWKNVLLESASAELIDLLRRQTGIGFNTMCTFSSAYGNQGCMQDVHLDGAVIFKGKNTDLVLSTIGCMLYFNEQPDNTTGTCMYTPDKKTVLFKAPSMRNGLLFFEQHPAAWHGFSEMPAGTERRLVSLAYSQEPTPIDLQASLLHKLTCRLRYKAIAKRFLKDTPIYTLYRTMRYKKVMDEERKNTSNEY